MTLSIEHRLPNVETFRALRSHTDWGVPTVHATKAALTASLCGAVAIQDGQTVAMVRAVGDGVLKVYIQDVIVAKPARSQGIGHALVQTFITHLMATYPPACMIGLFAAEGQGNFYERFGFIARPGIGFGPGMHATLSNLAQPDLAKPHNAA